MSIVKDLATLAMPSLTCSMREGFASDSVGAVDVVVFVAGSPANLDSCVSRILSIYSGHLRAYWSGMTTRNPSEAYLSACSWLLVLCTPVPPVRRSRSLLGA
jgi:hypothetical protein